MMPFEVEGLPFKDFLEGFEFEGKEEKPREELLKYFKEWLEREWAYFNLSRHFKNPGVTITPLSFVDKETVERGKKEEKLKIIPRRKFKLRIGGSPDSLMICAGISWHEAVHLHQPLVDQYIFNELIISMIAEFLKNDRNLLGIKKYVKYLNNLKLSSEIIKFLEIHPCRALVAIPYIFAERGFIRERDANWWSRYFFNFIIESEKHRSGLVKSEKILREDVELGSIFIQLSLFKLMGIDEAEKEARRLRREGYTSGDLPEIYRGNFSEYSKKINSSLGKISNEGRRIVGERMNLFKELWERFSKAKNLDQDEVFNKYRCIIIIKDGERYWVDRPIETNPEYVEVIVSYLSDAYIARKIVEEASKEEPDFEKAIRGSCIWRKNEYQFKCYDKDECEHEKRWLDLL